MSGEERDPLEGVPAELRDWHQGALEGDLAVCGAPQPGRPGFPCIQNSGFHQEHRDVFGHTWPAVAEEPLYVAQKAARNADGTVTVDTRDYGPVTFEEPDWCNGVHRQGGFRADIAHHAEDTHMVFNVGQAEGPAELLTSYLTQRPFSPTDAGLYVAVELGDQFVELDPDGLSRLAAALVEHASVLRHAARRLTVLREGS